MSAPTFLSLLNTQTYSAVGTTVPDGSITTISNNKPIWGTTFPSSLSYSTLTGSTMTNDTMTVRSTLSVSSMTTSGNVGVGLTNPSYRLDVNGALRVRGSDTLNQYNALLLGTSADTGRAISMLNSNMTNGTIMYHAMGKANSAYNQMEIAYNHVSDGSLSNFISYGLHTVPQTLCINGASNVGIGTTIPASRMDVRGSIFGNGIYSLIGGTTDTNGYVTLLPGGPNNTGFIEFRRAGGTRDGYIGFGGLSDIFFNIEQARNLRFHTNSVERMVIASGGNVGIGTTTPGYTFHVQGAIYASGEITGLSDQRFKTDVEPLQGSLENVSKLQGVSYRRTDEDPEKKRIGLLAQAVAEVYPEAVSYDETNDRYSLNYMSLVAPLIEAVKELRVRVNTQAQEMAELKREIRERLG